MPTTPARTLDHLFRTEYARLVSLLVSRYKPDYVEWIEDAVQEGMLKATKVWGYAGVPANPSAWLYRVAHNALLDRFRKENRAVVTDETPEQTESTNYEQRSHDSQLEMIFACCHPALSQQDQLILSLKILGGLSIKEIAQGLMKSDESIKKDYQRARTRFRDKVGNLELPQAQALVDRLNNVLQVIYLLFNEGYKASSGKALIKRDFCEEALALGLMLLRDSRFATPDTHALVALICFNMARFDTRTDADGYLIPLAEQDRTLWDHDLIRQGFYHLDQAEKGEELTRYQLEACIAAVHAAAPDYESTQWETVLAFYDKLYEITQSPLVDLNRVVAIAEVKGADQAMRSLQQIQSDPLLADYYLTYCIEADLYQRMGQDDKAIDRYRYAEHLTDNEAERTFIRKKWEQLAAK